MLKKIYDENERLIALVISSRFYKECVEFFTPPEFSQQLGYMNHPKGKVIPAHIHNPVDRNVLATQEVLFIRRGRVLVDLYTAKQTFLASIELTAGDVILLAAGGHGLTMLEPTEIIEVKQGPYQGDRDKTVLSL